MRLLSAELGMTLLEHECVFLNWLRALHGQSEFGPSGLALSLATFFGDPLTATRLSYLLTCGVHSPVL